MAARLYHTSHAVNEYFTLGEDKRRGEKIRRPGWNERKKETETRNKEKNKKRN